MYIKKINGLSKFKMIFQLLDKLTIIYDKQRQGTLNRIGPFFRPTQGYNLKGCY